MNSRTFWLCAGLISAFSLWLRAGFPALGLGDSTYDDMLFVKMAGYMGARQWLGPYNELTLAKGMFFPLFVLIAFIAAIPLKIAEQVVYLAACALSARFVASRARSERLALMLFAALAFNPVLWTGSLSRVMREGIYLSLCLIVVTLALAILFPPEDNGTGKRTRLRRALLGIGFGIALAAFWLTREEGYWILPALAFPLCAVAVHLRRSGAIAGRLWPMGLGAAVFALGLSLVAGMNLAHYGVFRLTDFQSGNFLKAYGAIARIKPDSWQRYVAFPMDARRRAYAVSSALRELQPYLDGDTGEKWRSIGCEQSGMTAEACPDILLGWFMWALRDATAKAGHYGSATEADAFYKKLADEIDAACENGKFACMPRRATMLPPLRWEYLIDAWRPAAAITVKLLHLDDGEIGVPPSTGEESILRIYEAMTGGISPKDFPPATVIRGWAGSSAGIPQIYVAGDGDLGVHTSVEILDPLLLPQPLIKTGKGIPFIVTTDCPAARCFLVVADGTDETRIPLNALPLAKVAQGRMEVLIDISANGHLRDKAGNPVQMRRAIQLRIATAIAHIYWYAIPVLSVGAGLGLCVCLILRRRFPVLWPPRMAPVRVLILTGLIAVALRIALLSLMDVSSIPGISLLYASCVSTFVIIFAIAGVYLSLAAILSALRSPVTMA